MARPLPRPPGRRSLRVVVVVVALLAACGDQRTANHERDIAIYRSAVQWLLEEGSRDDDLPVTVYVEALEEEIPLEVQAGLVETLNDVATIRFVDDIEEAVDTGEPGDPVRGDGVLLGLGPVRAARGDRAALHVERYRDRGDAVAHEMALARRNGSWRVTGDPQEAERLGEEDAGDRQS